MLIGTPDEILWKGLESDQWIWLSAAAKGEKRDLCESYFQMDWQ
jgi:hypothetical protein